jgi:hypothetical protein
MAEAVALIDNFIGIYPVSRKRVEALRPLARRVYFDKKASHFLGRFIFECTDLIIENREFALAPYPVTYLEMDMDAVFSHGTKRACDQSHHGRMGYLLDGKTIYVFIDGSFAFKDKPSVLSCLEFSLNTPVSIEGMDQHELSRRAYAILGESPDFDWPETLDVIRSVSMVDRLSSKDVPEHNPENTTGDVRNVWAALLMLNQPANKVTLERVPFRKALIKGKRHVYAPHHSVTVHVGDREPIPRAFSLSTRSPLRRHEVRGHYMHFGFVRDCEHDWQPLNNSLPIKRWQCPKCSTRRTWRPSFERGDASLGYVTKTYTATG